MNGAHAGTRRPKPALAASDWGSRRGSGTELHLAPAWHGRPRSARERRPAAHPARHGACARWSPPPSLTGGLTELAWVGAHVLHVPARHPHRAPAARRRATAPATSRPRSARCSPPTRSPRASRSLLVHGLVDNRSVFTVMRRSLRRRGLRPRLHLELQPAAAPTSPAARPTSARTSSGSASETGHDRVHVVGHSLGGLIARYYVQRQGGDRRVASLVTLGTPHEGSVWAHVRAHAADPPAAPRLAGAPRAGRAGAGLPHPDHRRSTATSTRWSSPRARAGCDHPDLDARNVLVRGVGHMSLPHPPRRPRRGRRDPGRAASRRTPSDRSPPPDLAHRPAAPLRGVSLLHCTRSRHGLSGH